MRVPSSVALMLSLALALWLAPHVALADKEGAPRADTAKVRALLDGRQFAKLTALLESYQAQSEKDIRWEFAVLDGFNVFVVARPADKDLLNEWVHSAPKSWVPLLRGRPTSSLRDGAHAVRS